MTLRPTRILTPFDYLAVLAQRRACAEIDRQRARAAGDNAAFIMASLRWTEADTMLRGLTGVRS